MIETVTPPPEISVQQIKRELGMDAATVRKWLREEGVQPIRIMQRGDRPVPFYEPSAIEAVRKHKQVNKVSTAPNIDPVSGLTWSQKFQKERANEAAARNERQRRLDEKEIMPTADHYRILSALTTRLEQIPAKAQSEYGLTELQATGLRKMLDDARTDAAKEI